ncbi:MAG: bifunctional diaminohydroxyphosphoribosylaminopyrimidine deaminase/5-amino-6-(5-phosphoribosylamino)uracil reductase RibD [Planctomycetota bacterium]
MAGFSKDDERHLARALQLARRGQGYVEPNPMVGCVVVRGGRVLGEGWHRRFGEPHAEIEALRAAQAAHGKNATRGATVYVTLEPCCHTGKTPPCTDALIAAGVARVVALMQDPNPRVCGAGAAALRKAGVRSELASGGPLHAVAAELNAPFTKLMTQRRPWVILKWAQSLDGKIATRTGDSKWITDEACRAHAHRTRGRVDGILVGVGTVLSDNPLLTCRVGRPRRIAARIVLDTHLRTPRSAQLVRTACETPTLIFCGPDAPARRVRVLEAAGCVVERVQLVGRGRPGQSVLSPPAVLDALGRRQMTNLLVEGGGRVLGNVFDAGLADELHVYVAPLLIGGAAAPGPLHGRGPATIGDAVRLRPKTERRCGAGRFLRILLNPTKV